MTTYWDNASLGGKNLEFEINRKDGSFERIRTSAHVPDKELVKNKMETVTLCVTHRNYTYRFETGVLTGIRNGTPEFYPPAQVQEASAYERELVDDLLSACRSMDSYRRGELPEAIIGVLELGANIYPCGKQDAA